jgi:hypothetical protein
MRSKGIETVALPSELVELLACPLCRSRVSESRETLDCSNAECGLRFPVRNGIPFMLLEEADRSCPGCGKPRAWSGETISCEPCGKSFKGRPVTV